MKNQCHNQWRRWTAVHEAGHALAYWWNGQGIHSVSVRTKAEILAGQYVDRRGRESNPGGIVEASDFIGSPSLIREYRLYGMYDGLQEMVARDLLHAFSGPVAEALHRGVDLEWVLYAGGRSDWQHASELLALLPDDDRPEAERLAIARCRELMRHYWPAVQVLASVLQARGVVDGEEVERLLCANTGERPSWRGNDVSSLDKPLPNQPAAEA